MPEHTPLWRLDGAHSTLILLPGLRDEARAIAGSAAGVDALPGDLATAAIGGGVPRLYYFGDRLALDPSVDECALLDDDALAYATLDAPEPLTLCPEASHGHAGSPGLAGHRDGRRFAHRWTLTEARAFQDDASSNRLAFTLRDADGALQLDIALALDPDSDVLSIATTLHNLGDDAYTVDWLASATLPLPRSHVETLSQHGRWGGEFREHRRALGPGLLDISNRHGRTSHQHAPFIATGSPGFGNGHGDVLAAHLGFSGNFSLRTERLSNGTATLQLGLLPLPGECRLAPGERLEAPIAYAARGHGLNACTAAFHTHARLRILPAFTRRPRPVHANSWEAMYFDHDPAGLLELIDAGAALGAERFVLDDGWFLRRRHDNAGLGDWLVDHEVYPDGLAPIVARVRQHGMQFGLWFEPEMVNPDSALYEDHPEWVLHLAGIDTPLARDQLVLDISRRDVRDYLFEHISSLCREHAIDYIKWDMNRDLVLAGDGSRARAARQPQALYDLLADLRAAFPALEIETCASGGARADFGVLRHTGRVWASDNIDPIERTRIQAGFLRWLPPEIMGAHVGHESAHLTGRVTDLHTRGIVALQGQFGFELDARRLEPATVVGLHHYTSLYKTHREWLAESRHLRLDCPGEPAIMASMQVARDGTIALLWVVAVETVAHSRPGRLQLAGLQPDRRYRVSLASDNRDALVPYNRHMPSWLAHAATTTGELLMNLGLPLPVMPAQSSLLAVCHAVPDAGHDASAAATPEPARDPT